ncbi:HdeD family acid-resistance protein [Pseudonocardia pini]|uniref:HdeD family acid-resistance protein n=1 Tax=Pseudonocardia pini TaxID=2758030 RepID=UPI0015EFE816|nr:HdeD family acid-resistance protein [Pseudonocardia pini]
MTEASVDPDLQATAKTVWWLALLRGVLLVIFGIVALVSPGIALGALILVFGIYAIMDGLTAVVMGIRTRKSEKSWGWIVAQGVISVLAGLIALVYPGATALSLLFVIAFWAIVLGVAAIAEGIRSRRTDDRWGWTIAKGVLDVLFGILLLVWPATGILTLLWLVGVFAVAGGIVLAVLAFRIRKLAKAA